VTAAALDPGLSAYVRLVRPRQWIKNVFVVAPLFFTPSALSSQNLALVGLAFAVFCLFASTVYIVNDYFDREADRLHPEKRNRPLASGQISPATAWVLAAVLAGIASVVSLTLMPPLFAAMAFGYLGLNLLYSMWLKHVSLLDVMIISIGFVLRVDAGAVVIGVDPTVWITVCTWLLALFLALAKRRDDLVRALSGSHRPSLGGYNLPFIDASLAMVLGSLLVSYIIYTTTNTRVPNLYLTAPFVVAGVLRYLQITLVEQRSGSPTDLALRDRFLVGTVLGWIATFGILLYS
jgi:decaprenyl-phosphate phosphoribosyltransferase